MKTISAISFIALFIFSCKKNSETSTSNFKWVHQSVNYTATSSEAYITQIDIDKGPNQILAFTGNITPYFRISIRLTSLNPNSYPVSLSTNKFDYIDDSGNDLAGASGSVTISSNTNKKLSGTFTVKLINALSDTSLITGSFDNIKVNP